MPYPGLSVYPSSRLFPGMGGADLSGNPTGINESGYWGGVNNSRPDVLRWLAVDLLSGLIICDLPSLQSQDPNRRTINQYESQTLDLYVTDAISPSWRTGTRPGACALIAYRGLPGMEVIYWGGIVLRRQSAAGSNKVTLTAATPECYLDRRYTGAYTTDPGSTGARLPQNQIVADLITQFVVANHGLPVSVVQLPSVGTTRYQVYNDYDDKTVYSNIGALVGLVSGPEFTAHWVWDRVANLITPVVYVGDRIGQAAVNAPAATFDSANLIAATLDENYTSGAGGGANDITATSSGQGLARPQATSPNPPSTSLDGRPRFQFRYSPSTSIQDPLTLQAHADRALALLGGGTNTVTLKAAAGVRPFLGVDWNLGDDIGYELDGPAFPAPLVGVGRCIGYEASDVYTSPVLYIPKVI